MDLTGILRYIDGSGVSGINYAAADVNSDGQVDIFDATRIQLYLSGLSPDGGIGISLRELCMPRELRCTCAGSEYAEVQWDAPAAGADGYEVYVGTAADGGEEHLYTEVTEPICEVEDLSPNTEYIITIRSCRIIDGNVCYAESGAQLSIITMPTPVRELTQVLTVDRVYMTWAPSDGADGYEIYCDTGNGPAMFGETDQTSYRSSDITGNTKYRFSVRTYKYVNGIKIISADESRAEGWSSPSMPGFTVTGSNGVYTVKWSKTKGADKYEVMIQTPDEDEMRVVALTDALTYSIPAKGIPEALFAVRSVKYADGEEYRSEYRKKACSRYDQAGTIGTFGDSIAFAVGAHQFGYSEMIGYNHRMRVDNRAVNSATLGITYGKHCICDDVLAYVNNDSTYDYILVEGGVNDYFNDIPLGTVTPSGTTVFDRTTVCGALEMIFSRIRSTAPSAKTVFVIAHDILDTRVKKNDQGLTFLDYSEGIREVCEKYGIEIADCSTELTTSDPDMERQYTYTWRGIFPDSDGIHPNEEGYRRFYVPVIEEKMFGK